MKSKLFPEKFIGKIYWIDPSIYSIPVDNEVRTNTQVADIARAISIGDKFTIEWKSRKFGNGEIKLHSKDTLNFQGQFNYKYDDYSVTGKAFGRLFNSKDDSLFIGKWFEENDELTWIVELKKVNKFSDEKK